MIEKNLLAGSKAWEKGRSNEQVILKFLAVEIFSKAKILSELLSIKSHSSVLKILRRMQEKGLITKHVVNNRNTVWGITNHGLQLAVYSDSAVNNQRYFIPSRINTLTLEHTFDGQYVHAICSNNGLEYRPGSLIGSRSEFDKIPDGIIHTAHGDVAVEVERTIKTKQRYDAIIYNYLKLIKKGVYSKVLYVTPDMMLKMSLRKLFYSMKFVTMNVLGQKKKARLDEEKHLTYFHFISRGELQEYFAKLIKRE